VLQLQTRNEHTDRLKTSPAHTQEGDTALSLALIQSTTNGRLDVVQLLLDSKADIHAANKVLYSLPCLYCCP
jgi:hypothetical protein